eukprot:333246-Pelagomonas_calceolata.AAC.1
MTAYMSVKKAWPQACLKSEECTSDSQHDWQNAGQNAVEYRVQNLCECQYAWVSERLKPQACLRSAPHAAESGCWTSFQVYRLVEGLVA